MDQRSLCILYYPIGSIPKRVEEAMIDVLGKEKISEIKSGWVIFEGVNHECPHPTIKEAFIESQYPYAWVWAPGRGYNTGAEVFDGKVAARLEMKISGEIASTVDGAPDASYPSDYWINKLMGMAFL